MSELFKWDRGAKLFLHNLLGADHGDTLAGNVAAGDLIHGNATPKWARLAKGTQGQVLRMGASLPAWYSEDGWIDCSGETWAYGSVSTILVTGDYSTKYKKGLFISWVQTTTKYGVLASDSSYNSGTDKTTLTIIVNTDHVVANAAISGQKISFAANPQGWPGWFNYSPTWTASSSNPVLGSGTLLGRYFPSGKKITMFIDLTLAADTTTGTGLWRFSTPCIAVTLKYYQGTGLTYDASPSTQQQCIAQLQSATYVSCFPYNSINGITATSPWTWAANDVLRFQIDFEMG